MKCSNGFMAEAYRLSQRTTILTNNSFSTHFQVIFFCHAHCTLHLIPHFQAFLIAFTSEFLPRLLYQYEYEWNLHGYMNFTLAVSPNNTLNESCRYKYTCIHLLFRNYVYCYILDHTLKGGSGQDCEYSTTHLS